ESVFERAESKATNSLLYSIAMGMSAYGSQDLGFNNLSLDERIYLAQAEVIRKVATEGSCVIVGRCADYILKENPNVVNVFVWADINSRVERATTMYNMPTKKAEENILKIDKRRANYYNYHANEKWGKAENYHLSIKSDYVGIDNAVEVIKLYVEKGV
ncbi:cytidylate kinase-like family protein, partial [Anaerosporobacter sp.]